MSATTDHAFRSRVAAAEYALRRLFPETPLQLNEHLSRKWDARIYLKREDLTPVRSYKIRGAFNFMRKFMEAGGTAAQFVCASAGNHAQGFAFACRHFGARGRVYMPVTTPQQKIDKTRTFGGDAIEIVLVGDFFDDCYAAARAFAGETGAAMVPPFDHADIVEGQASVGLEIERQLGGLPDLLVMPVGGGGLASGLVRWFGGDGAPRFRFVEPLGAPSLRTSLSEGRRERLVQIDGFVDGAAVAEIGALPFEILKGAVEPEDVLLSPEGRLCLTMLEMLNTEGIVLEPAGALTVDALNALGEEVRGRSAVLVVSGGNFDFERLPDVKERALRFAGRKKYFILRLPQRPGALKDFLQLLGPEDDVARFEYLKKTARDFGSILLGVETSAPENFDALLKRLDADGFRYQDITNDPIVADLLI